MKVIPAFCKALGKFCILGQKSVSRMDRINAVFQAQSDDSIDVQVRSDGLARFANWIGLVGLEFVQSETIFVRVDRNSPNLDLVALRKIRVAISLRLAASIFLKTGIDYGLSLVGGEGGGEPKSPAVAIINVSGEINSLMASFTASTVSCEIAVSSFS